MGQLFAVGDEMSDIDIAVVSPHEHVISDLVSVEVDSINLKGQYELFQSCDEFCTWLAETVVVRCKHAERIGRSRVHTALLL